MKLPDFYYNLPKELIAQHPAEKRDESRLLVLHRRTGKIEHRIFKDIIEYLDPGDILVLNNTKVLPARLMGRKETGGKVEALILNAMHGCTRAPEHQSTSRNKSEYEVLLKPARGCRAGSRIIFGPSPHSFKLTGGSGSKFCQKQNFYDLEIKAEITRIENGRRFLKFDCNGDLGKMLDKIGEIPLPPYIRREIVDFDTERYQTVYASKNGAVAAPTAGLHFTKELLGNISKKRVDVEYVTLHVGYGTFRPVISEDIKEHKMEKEYFEIENKVIERLNNKNGRVVAVGTTSARVLESFYTHVGTAQCAVPTASYDGWTDLFIYPGYKFKTVDALLTNFHLPKTTLLMLVSAFCGVGAVSGRPLLFKAYEEAIKEKYRFYSYGDAMLII